MFVIKDYRPKFYSNCKDFMLHNRFLINRILGQKVERIYWVWENSCKEWIRDFPVVLELTDGSCTLCSNRHSEFSIGWNNIDFDKKLILQGANELSLEWKEYNSKRMEKIIGQKIESVEIINFLPTHIEDFPIYDRKEARIIKRMGFLHGVGFNFSEQTMLIVNGLYDNNIIFIDREFPSYYRRIIING